MAPKADNTAPSTADVVAAMAMLLPDADTNRLAAHIAALKLLPRQATGLLAYVKTHPDALTSGDATGPSALRRLLEVLAADHPAVQRMRCHRCGTQTRLPYRKDGASICGNCYRQTRFKMCVRCGQLGQPARGEAGGVICTRCYGRDPARRRACARCGTLAPVAYRVDGQPLCQKCGPHKLYTCSSCGRQNRQAHAITATGPICSICYRRSRQHECVQCGRITAEARLASRDTGTWICNRCWTPPTATCTSCGRLRPCAKGGASGRPVCSTCSARQRPPRACALCARTVAIQTTLPIGAVCGPCYRRLRRHPGACANCGETRPLVGADEASRGICGPCCGDDRNWVCTGCGRVDLLIAASQCLACTVKARVRNLLSGSDGHIPAQLHGVATLLLVDNTAEQTREVLNSCQWIQLLSGLVTSGKPISHEVLNELDQSMHVRHLRHLLIHTGALDEQPEGLEDLEPWMTNLFAGLSPRTACVLRRYASWSLLPRARRRAAHGQITASTPKYLRTRILAAQQFLRWLETNQIELADATQHDVDTWLALGASTRLRLRDFLRWAHTRGLAADLEVRWLGSQGLPEQILDADERWALLRRCLRDDNLSLRLRVAGALVLLYGQIPSRMVELTADSVTITGSDTYLALHDQPVLVPPPLAALLVRLVAFNSQHVTTTSSPDSPAWLFPGTRVGSHLGHGRLTRLLNNDIGLSVRPARGAALSDLAGDLPVPVLADLLGLSITSATRWVALAALDEADYLAARIAEPPEQADTVVPIGVPDGRL